MDFPGFPTNDFDHSFETVAPALAGLIVRDMAGVPRAGLLPSRPDLLRVRADWTLDAGGFVAVRKKGRAVLIGGSADDSLVSISPAPSANARIDVIYTRPADVGASESIEGLQVVTGTPGAVPAKPAIPAEAIEVGTLRVPAGAVGTSGAILTLTFPTTVTAGGLIPFRTTAERSAFAAIPGQLCSLGGDVFMWSGSAWVRFVLSGVEKWVGQLPARSVPANSSVTVDLAFLENRFSVAPIVVPALRGTSGKGSCSVAAISATGCQIRLNNFENASRMFGAEITAERAG